MESIITYACYTIGDSYALKARATIERIITYACYTVGNYYVSYKFIIKVQICTIAHRVRRRITKRNLQPIFNIPCIIYVLKACAIIERIVTYACYTIGDSYTRKACAIIERSAAYAFNTISDYYTLKACAIKECIVAYAYYTIGDSYTRKACAIIERSAAYAFNTISDYYTLKACAIIECIVAYAYYTIGNYYVSYKLIIKVQICTLAHRVRIQSTKRNLQPIFNISCIIYILKARAIIERLRTNACYTISDSYTLKACAILERALTNACNTIFDYYTC